jgi:hypothetical protein
MHPLLRDPRVAAKIEAAIAPYRDRLTPEQIEIFRQKMAWTLATHPAAARLLRAEQQQGIDASGEQTIGPAATTPVVVPAPTAQRKAR